jgi:hypothetical protein
MDGRTVDPNTINLVHRREVSRAKFLHQNQMRGRLGLNAILCFLITATCVTPWARKLATWERKQVKRPYELFRWHQRLRSSENFTLSRKHIVTGPRTSPSTHELIRVNHPNSNPLCFVMYLTAVESVCYSMRAPAMCKMPIVSFRLKSSFFKHRRRDYLSAFYLGISKQLALAF